LARRWRCRRRWQRHQRGDHVRNIHELTTRRYCAGPNSVRSVSLHTRDADIVQEILMHVGVAMSLRVMSVLSAARMDEDEHVSWHNH
jgi:hypothetical protein